MKADTIEGAGGLVYIAPPMESTNAALSEKATEDRTASSATCPVCGAPGASVWASATDVEYLTTSEKFRYRRCSQCDVLFIDPIPRTQLAQIYPANYYSFKATGPSLAASIKDWLDGRLFRRLLRSIPGESLNALDVGGGAGLQLKRLREVDARIQFTQVVDLDPGAAAEARANGHQYHCGRIEEFSTDRRFDLVLMLNLIEHVDDPAGVLAKMRDLLSPQGVLLIKTPNYDSWDARLFKEKNWAGYHCPRHWVLFTRESFTALVEKSGLKVQSFSYTQGAPFWTASVLAWLADRGLAKISAERPVVYHPAFGLLNMIFAGLDFARLPFARTSQMFLTLVPGRAG